MKYKPDWSKKVTSVIPAHGGASYNPDFDAHQDLLRQEVDKAEKEKAVRNKYFQKAKAAPIGNISDSKISNLILTLTRRTGHGRRYR